MDTVKKYKWYIAAVGVILGGAIVAYKILTHKKKIVPDQQMRDDKEGLGTIRIANQVLVPEQLAELEGFAQKYFHMFIKKEWKERQVRRCALLELKKTKEYYNALMADIEFEHNRIEEIYKELCEFYHVPLALFKRSQEFYTDKKGADYKSTFSKFLNKNASKSDHEMNEDTAKYLWKEFIAAKEQKRKDLETVFTQDLKGKIGQQSEAESIDSMATLMAFDTVYVIQKLTQDDARELFNFYNIREVPDEVFEIK